MREDQTVAITFLQKILRMLKEKQKNCWNNL